MNPKGRFINYFLNRWPLLAVAATTLVTIVISILCLTLRFYIIFQNLFYIPIIIACIHYKKRGFAFSLVLILLYFSLITAFARNPTIILEAFIRVITFTLVAWIITFLALSKENVLQELLQKHTELKNLINASSQVSIITTNISGTILTFNIGAERMTGYSAKEMIGKQTPIIMHLESELAARGRELTEELGYLVEGFEVLVANARQGKYEEREWTRVRKDGTHFTINLATTAIKNEAGKTISFLNVATDITARKQAEEALKESQKRFKIIFEEVTDGILLADLETKKFYFGNKTIYQMLGFNEEEIRGLSVMDIHPQEGLPYVLECFEKQSRGEITLAKDIPVKRKDGSVFYADVNSAPITLTGKTYLIGIFRDITEYKRLEEELKKEMESLERFNKLAVGRELKMIELKAKIKEVEARLENKQL